MMTTDERLGRIETKIDAIAVSVDAHIAMHSGDKERIAALEQKAKDDTDAATRRQNWALGLLAFLGILAGVAAEHIRLTFGK